jgi:hypothetical protein
MDWGAAPRMEAGGHPLTARGWAYLSPNALSPLVHGGIKPTAPAFACLSQSRCLCAILLSLSTTDPGRGSVLIEAMTKLCIQGQVITSLSLSFLA